jgi:hypothetical protein
MWLKLILPLPPSVPPGQVVGTFLLLLASATGRHVTGGIDSNIESFNDTTTIAATTTTTTTTATTATTTNVDDPSLEDLGSREEVGEDAEIQCGLAKETSNQTMMWNGRNVGKIEHPWQVRKI